MFPRGIEVEPREWSGVDLFRFILNLGTKKMKNLSVSEETEMEEFGRRKDIRTYIDRKKSERGGGKEGGKGGGRWKEEEKGGRRRRRTEREREGEGKKKGGRDRSFRFRVGGARIE